MITYEKAYAKLNLDLFVIDKRRDGFHELKSIAVPIDFFDELTFEFHSENTIDSNKDIKDNLILKTVKKFQEYFDQNRNVKVTLNKNIPIGSGLGGGSANAAATIRGLNKLYNLNYELDKFYDLALELGSDVLFCLYNRPAIISGRGEFLEFINYPEIKEIALLILPFKISTKEVFFNHRLDTKKELNIDTRSLYIQGDFTSYFNNSQNDLLATLLEINKEFSTLYNSLKKQFPLIKMSGSGPTLFIINPSKNDIKKLSQFKDIDIYLQKIQK